MPPALMRIRFSPRGVVPLLLTLGLIATACGGDAADASAADRGSPIPQQSGVSMSAEVATHHWLALEALQVEDVDGALHHVSHIIEALTGSHREAMVGVVADLEAGRLHDAEHTVEAMLAGRAEPNLTDAQMHLLLAVRALGVERRDDAAHHVRHFLEYASESDAVRARGILAALDEDRPEDATSGLGALTLELSQDQHARRSCGGAATGVVLPGGHLVIAAVMDDEWAALPDAGEAAVRAIVGEARAALDGLGLSLDLVDVTRWDAPAAPSLSALADSVVEAFPPRPGVALTVAFIAGDVEERADGFHSAHRRVIVVRRQPAGPGLESAVLVHEVGHHLGLRHETGTYMQSLGFPADVGWSECQRESVRTQIER